jgi:hypothetical protein
MHLIFNHLLIAIDHIMRQLTVTSKLKCVVPLPGGPPARSCMVIQMPSVNPSGFLANGCQSTRLTMFHGRGTDPVNPRIATNCIYNKFHSKQGHTVLRINKNNLKVFIGRILVDPIRIQNPQIGTFATNAFFSCGTQRTLVFQLIDSLVCLYS